MLLTVKYLPRSESIWHAGATAAVILTAACASEAEPSPHDVSVTDTLGEIGRPPPGDVPLYATGTSFQLWAAGEEELQDGWLIASDRPDIFEVDPTVVQSEIASAGIRAIAPGEAHLEVYDEAGRQAERVRARVRDTDRIALGDLSAAIQSVVGSRIRLLAEHEVMLEVIYMGGGDILAGRGLARADAETDLARIAFANLGTRAAEVLQVRAPPSGSYTAELSANGSRLNDLEVISIPPEEVSLVVHRPGDDPGDSACAAVELRDSLERKVHANPPEWTIDGETVGQRTMLCIDVDPDAPPQTATVSYGGLEQSLQLPGGAPRP